MNNIVKKTKLALVGLVLVGTASAQENFTQYVDPFIGSAEHGHVFVGANVPFGGVQLGPSQIAQTWDQFNGWDWCSGYNYKSLDILGFTHTHLSGTGIGDLNDILVVPANGTLQLSPAEFDKMHTGYGSHFKKENEVARPGFYSVYLDDYQVQANLTASERVGYHQYIYNKKDSAHILLDLGFRMNWDRPTDTYLQQVDETTFVGYRFSTGWASDQKVFFALKSSRPIKDVHFFDGKTPRTGYQTFKGQAIKAALYFDAESDNTIELKVGLSPVSTENALANIAAEIPHWNFEQAQNDADQKWNHTLGKIEVDGDSDTKTIFYTALYHSYFAPTIFNDHNGDYMGTDKQVHNANFTNYTIFSLWDTYRALHPLMTLLESRSVNQGFVKSMLSIYQQQGKLPVWHLWANETNTMVGLPAIPVLADAFLKGLIDEGDHDLLWEAVKTTAMGDDFGLEFVRNLTYIPIDSMENESVAWGLEYAIADYGAYRIAEKLGKQEEAEYFKKRAKLYEQYYDKEKRFFVGRWANGEFRRPFDPFMAEHRSNDYCEGNGWQYLWLVPHDVDGLTDLLGGRQAFIDRLDEFINLPEELDNASPDITGLIGQYAQGNEPNHHVPYLFALAGEHWKTAKLVHAAMVQNYTSAPNGLCGNDDAGQMSAWYVFSSMGLYPANPMDSRYVLGTPLLRQAKINLPNGNSFEVLAKNQSDKNIYIKSAKLNGKPFNQVYLTHDEILAGGQLELEMSSKPNKKFGK